MNERNIRMKVQGYIIPVCVFTVSALIITLMMNIGRTNKGYEAFALRFYTAATACRNADLKLVAGRIASVDNFSKAEAPVSIVCFCLLFLEYRKKKTARSRVNLKTVASQHRARKPQPKKKLMLRCLRVVNKTFGPESCITKSQGLSNSQHLPDLLCPSLRKRTKWQLLLSFLMFLA